MSHPSQIFQSKLYKDYRIYHIFQLNECRSFDNTSFPFIRLTNIQNFHIFSNLVYKLRFLTGHFFTLPIRYVEVNPSYNICLPDSFQIFNHRFQLIQAPIEYNLLIIVNIILEPHIPSIFSKISNPNTIFNQCFSHITERSCIYDQNIFIFHHLRQLLHGQVLDVIEVDMLLLIRNQFMAVVCQRMGEGSCRYDPICGKDEQKQYYRKRLDLHRFDLDYM